MTSKHTQQNLFSLTSSAGAFRAKIYPLEANAKESRPRHVLDFSLNLSESFAWYDPGTFCWKTWQRCLISEWTLFSGNFPKQGTMLNGRLYQPNKEALVIKEKESGSLPTPNTMDYLPPRGLASMIKQTQTHRKGRKKLGNLREAVNPKTVELFNKLQNLPTPRANQAMAANLDLPSIKNHSNPNLETIISNLPTPCSRDYKDAGENLNFKKIAEKGKLSGVLNHTYSTQTGKGTFLNPPFVEEMMGYPIGWTDYAPSETA